MSRAKNKKDGKSVLSCTTHHLRWSPLLFALQKRGIVVAILLQRGIFTGQPTTIAVGNGPPPYPPTAHSDDRLRNILQLVLRRIFAPRNFAFCILHFALNKLSYNQLIQLSITINYNFNCAFVSYGVRDFGAVEGYFIILLFIVHCHNYGEFFIVAVILEL